jgi:hypothetical protein
MELIIGLIVIAAVGYIVFRKKDEPVAEAPYKVETPTVTSSGEPPATVTVVEGAGAVVVEEVKVEEAPVVEAPAKKPRKPRAPKAEAPAAKKAAPKKAAAIKAKPKATKSKKA